MQDHIIHFYHLHALDWVDITGALKADPAKTSQLAQSISDWPKSSTVYFKAVQDRVKALVASGQLGFFSSGDWGNPAHRLPPEVDLLAVAHYIEALDLQREFIRIQAVLGGKNPHPQTYLVGGMATVIDGNEPEATTGLERITLLNQLVKNGQTFVRQVYLPDVLAIAGFYRDWFTYGEWPGLPWPMATTMMGSLKDPAKPASSSHAARSSGTRSFPGASVRADERDGIRDPLLQYEYPEGNQIGKHPSQGEK